MKLLKIILISIISVVMVSVSVVQYHHHDSHGKICLSLLKFHTHSHPHSHADSQDHDHHCAAKISIMDFVEKVTDKCPVIAELQLLWSPSDYLALQPIVISLLSFDLLFEELCGRYELSGLGGISFRAPPATI